MQPENLKGRDYFRAIYGYEDSININETAL
jgi:hypothetical protein